LLGNHGCLIPGVASSSENVKSLSQLRRRSPFAPFGGAFGLLKKIADATEADIEPPTPLAQTILLRPIGVQKLNHLHGSCIVVVHTHTVSWNFRMPRGVTAHRANLIARQLSMDIESGAPSSRMFARSRPRVMKTIAGNLGAGPASRKVKQTVSLVLPLEINSEIPRSARSFT
jgi:hypothetical protein